MNVTSKPLPASPPLPPDTVEGVGMDGRGAGTGDANIGSMELARVAQDARLAPHVRAAAQWMLDHPTATRAIDQGAGLGRGEANEYHFSRARPSGTRRSSSSRFRT